MSRFLKVIYLKECNTIQQLELTTIGKSFYTTKAWKIISFSLTVDKNSFIAFTVLCILIYIRVNRKSFESSKSLLI